MKNHDDITYYVSRYLAGLLVQEEAEIFEEELRTNSALRAELEEQQEITTSVGSDDQEYASIRKNLGTTEGNNYLLLGSIVLGLSILIAILVVFLQGTISPVTPSPASTPQYLGDTTSSIGSSVVDTGRLLTSIPITTNAEEVMVSRSIEDSREVSSTKKDSKIEADTLVAPDDSLSTSDRDLDEPEPVDAGLPNESKVTTTDSIDTTEGQSITGQIRTGTIPEVTFTVDDDVFEQLDILLNKNTVKNGKKFSRASLRAKSDNVGLLSFYKSTFEEYVDIRRDTSTILVFPVGWNDVYNNKMKRKRRRALGRYERRFKYFAKKQRIRSNTELNLELESLRKWVEKLRLLHGER